MFFTAQCWRVDLGESHPLTQSSVQFENADREQSYPAETARTRCTPRRRAWPALGFLLGGIRARSLVGADNGLGTASSARRIREVGACLASEQRQRREPKVLGV